MISLHKNTLGLYNLVYFIAAILFCKSRACAECAYKMQLCLKQWRKNQPNLSNISCVITRQNLIRIILIRTVIVYYFVEKNGKEYNMIKEHKRNSPMEVNSVSYALFLLIVIIASRHVLGINMRNKHLILMSSELLLNASLLV